MKKKGLLVTKNICIIGALIALGMVLSSLLQFRLVGDIWVDLSYLAITVICVIYGGIVGSLSAGILALLSSALFGAYGLSISWIVSNVIIGLGTGLVAKS